MTWRTGLRSGVRRRRCAGAVAFAVGLTLTGAVNASSEQLAIPSERRTLENGLRVVVSPEHSIPWVYVTLMVNAGSRDERPGHAGLAHLLEHVLVLKDDQSAGVYARAASLTVSANTSGDRTSYSLIMPRQRLDLALFLISQLLNPAGYSEKMVDAARETVLRERLGELGGQTDADKARSELSIASRQLVYEGSRYERPTIGTPQDLASLTLSDVMDFLNRYYRPGNVVLAIVGDTDPASAFSSSERYFGHLLRTAAVPRASDETMKQSSARRRTLRDVRLASPMIAVSFQGPRMLTQDHTSLMALASIMRRSQRAADRADRDVTSAFYSAVDRMWGPSRFNVWAEARTGVSAETLERAVIATLDRFASTPPTSSELDAAKNRLRMWQMEYLSTPERRAPLLAELELCCGARLDVGAFSRQVERMTTEDVRQVAQRYLTPENRVVVTMLPGTPRDSGPEGGR